MSGYTGWRDADVSKLGANVQPRNNKYHARKVTLDGQKFDSCREAKRWQELKLLEQAGQIADLVRQRPFPLLVPRKSDGQVVLIATWVADFVYRRDGVLIVEDAKGVRTKDYILKRKLFNALYSLEINEV